jgi:phage terminase large subunit
MKELTIKHTPVFSKNYEALQKYKTIVNQGGSSSSKTYSILQLLIYLAVKEPNITIDIVRKHQTTLKKSSYRDFINILIKMDLYNEKSLNKSSLEYNFSNGSIIKFLGADDDNEVRGRRRDYLYINEGNELDESVYIQLSIRTRKAIFIDYNPSDFENWIDKVIEEPDTILIKSTYKDNTFLDKTTIDRLENLINTDENYYRIYVLGEKPIARSRIYTHFKEYNDIKEPIKQVIWGLDFGFQHVTSLVKVQIGDSGAFYVEEVIYESGLTGDDLVRRMQELEISKTNTIYCDYARPEIIESINRKGFNARNANKSVLDGIDNVKSSLIYIHKESVNIWNEFYRYNWKTNGERIIMEPVKLWDDALDALRYAIHTYRTNNTGTFDFFVV